MGERALRVFQVAYAGMRLRVRLLPNLQAVDREYREGKRRRERRIVHAFFSKASASSKFMGTVVLGLGGCLDEEVPHEVFHAVIFHKHTVNTENDEPAAYAVGRLSAKIFSIVRPYAARHSK